MTVEDARACVVKVMLRPFMDPADLQDQANVLWRIVERDAASAVARAFGATERRLRVDVLAFADNPPFAVIAQRSIQNGRLGPWS